MDSRMIRLAGFMVATLALPAATQAQTSATADVMAVVRQFVDGFNKGDLKLLSSACAEQVAIIDEFPPHAWQGAASCTRWSRDYDADAKKRGISDGLVTIGKPTHIDVAGDHAYVVGPANYAYKLKGKPVKEVGSLFTLALQKGGAGWRITGWSWAKH
jgi:ketosteroid isomerase-like protein